MNRDQFRDLLEKYTNGQCTEEEIRQIDQWFKDIADNSLGVDQGQVEEERTKILDGIFAAKIENADRTRTLPLALKVAASLAIFFIVGYFGYKLEEPETAVASYRKLDKGGKITMTNSSPVVRKVILPDSSFAEISPGSKMTYDSVWNGSLREVDLVGEAFFSVRSNPDKPFLVYSESIVTRVLGTSFSVSAFPNSKSVEVVVKTGRVSVYDNSLRKDQVKGSQASDGVVLKPNEKVKYFMEDKKWVTGLIDNPQPVVTENREETFVFNDTPLNEIIGYISEYYQIEILVETEDAVNCSFTGDVSKMELHDMLTIICESIGTRYEVKGSKIFVTGDGCKP